MSTAISSRPVDVVDVVSAQRYFPSGATQRLETCHLQQWGLSLECPTPDDPSHAGEITWLLPELGLRLTQYRPRSRHARRGSSLMTAARIEQDMRSWTVTDLFLGLEIAEHGTARVIRSEDFAAAVSGGSIRPSEADYALHTVLRTFDELRLHRDLNQWLAHRGVSDLW
ncbi:DUF402 domain-containing protein [Haloactinomyces albus]|uniref:RNA-binding protein associated with RNAse of E/G family n=1 Tax=Haloactinomyces albus TaxID=1352928 RepID=A0AAE4CN84_9ACTN|nr:hypothetical protein [Haloactinomyces albus]MDR7300388.1 putative RNA-binding protein associated with RNAse of E/G family [Haloactinomyces albus]